MLAFKDYQQRVLNTLDAYLTQLAAAKRLADKIELANLDETDADLIRPIPDWPAKAWAFMREKKLLPLRRIDAKPDAALVPFSPRVDGVGRPVPNICLKIPTGGGKTMLAAAAISSVFGKLLGKNTGFVLWIVPNEAIYTQTKKALCNQDHPYRQLLNKAAAGKVKILEKETRLAQADVDSHLCIMLLMLQSAGRESNATLKVFRDRGSISGFFPDETDAPAHEALLAQVPNLDAYEGGLYPQVKTSLGNALRLVRPMIVMDEQQKAYTPLAMKTLYAFNPQFVLELSATPKDLQLKREVPLYANVLVNILGSELDREGMVKLPLNVRVKAGKDWQDCLREAAQRMETLGIEAQAYLANGGRYIRPILLVQVERTGADQRDGLAIHADDAKDFLLGMGYADDEVAIKTSSQNDLKNPENIDLLSATCRVRVIITKAALQEGWDCPYAYVLCSLAASSNMNAMTQLVGRILRQPFGEKSGVAALDESYVFCNHTHTRTVIDGIKASLEADGLGDLTTDIREVNDDETATPGGLSPPPKRRLKRRAAFASTEIYLPKVLWVDGQGPRDLDYEADILCDLDWSALNLDKLIGGIPVHGTAAMTQNVKLWAGESEGKGEVLTKRTKSLQVNLPFDAVYATRAISDLIPNPWVAYGVVRSVVDALKARGFDAATLGLQASSVVSELRRGIDAQRDALAETRFMDCVARGTIQFKLRTDGKNWRLAKTIETDAALTDRKLSRNSGGEIEKSAFEPAYYDDYNHDERAFACHLDEQKAVQWWHRNVAKAGQYYVQGWKKPKVYPDFVFAIQHEGTHERVMVWETKGDQLAGSIDSAYKNALLERMTAAFAIDSQPAGGQVAGELAFMSEGKSVQAQLVLMSEWRQALDAVLAAGI